MNLIDYIYLLLECCRWIECFVYNFLSNIVHSCMRSGIDLSIIETCSCIDKLTITTFIARISILKIKTVESLCDQPSWSSLPRSSRSKKEIVMMDLISGNHLGFENITNMLLSDHLIKGLWTILVCEAHQNTQK